jgi:putative oxidoreductase
MNIASQIARYLLGLIFLVFGLNGFLNFIHMPPPGGIAGQFFGALFASKLYVVIFIFQIIPAVLLLVNRYVPFALTILGAIIFNIVCFHIFMAQAGLPLAAAVTVLWFLVFYRFSGCVHRNLSAINVSRSSRSSSSFRAMARPCPSHRATFTRSLLPRLGRPNAFAGAEPGCEPRGFCLVPR